MGHPQDGSVSCRHSPAGQFAFKSSCSFTCKEGFVLQGPTQTECTARGQWTQQAPTCEGKPGVPNEQQSSNLSTIVKPHACFTYGISGMGSKHLTSLRFM